MTDFLTHIRQKLQLFSHDLLLEIELSSPLFSLKRGKVVQFVEEMEAVAKLLMVQQQTTYVEYYAQRLIQQFDLLAQAVEKQKKLAKFSRPYRSSYRFPRHIHHLPIEKRLIAYQTALRALNEKLAWLSEQSYLAQTNERAKFVMQIEETEYRKQKCLAAIEELEQQALKRK